MRIVSMIASGVIVAGLMTVMGCGAVGGGKTVVKYDHGAAPIQTKAPEAGSYALYSTTDYNPKVVLSLQSGESLGFRKTDQGQLVAVAGSREIPLDDNSTYYWKRQ